MKKKLIPLLLMTIMLSSCGIFNKNSSSITNINSDCESTSNSILSTSSTVDYSSLSLISLDNNSCYS